MDGYEIHFERAEHEFENYDKTKLNYLFEHFAKHPKIFGFIYNPSPKPYEESVRISNLINKDLFNKYLEHSIKTKILCGYGEENNIYDSSFNELDSMHIMMNTALFSHVILNENCNIVEIGGGYGNWLRLNYNMQPFHKWIVVDLPHVSQLQEWFYTRHSIPKDKYELVLSNNYKEYFNKYNTIDLTICSHSLSEFSWNVFIEYFKEIVIKTKILFYSYHLVNLGDLAKLKINLIEQYFKPIFIVLSENDNVANCVYKNNMF